MDNWILGRRWNVIQAMPNNELLAAHSAREMGWRVFYPCYREKRRPHRGKPQEVTLPYLPGYLFVADDRFLSLWELSKAKGVTSVLRVGGEYAFIDDMDPVMRTLLKMADDDGFVKVEVAKKPITLYKKGDQVILDDGPFKSFPGVIHEISKNRKLAQVWVQIFGRPTNVEMHVEQLRQVQKRKVAA